MEIVRVCKDCGLEGTIEDLELFTYSQIHKHCRKNLCRECNSKQAKGRHNPTRAKDLQLRRLYNITLDDYNTMYNKQQGLCSICGDKHDVLCVDHCHSTGKVRGLLCRGCNLMIGNSQERSEVLERAKQYIIKHKG